MHITSGNIALLTDGGAAGTSPPPTFPFGGVPASGGLLIPVNQGQGIIINAIDSLNLASINNGANIDEDPAPVEGALSTTTAVGYLQNLVVPVPPTE